jgi:hypothetical protein
MGVEDDKTIFNSSELRGPAAWKSCQRVERSHEGGANDGPDSRDGHQALQRDVVRGNLRDRLIRDRDLFIQMPQRREHRSKVSARVGGSVTSARRLRKCSAAPQRNRTPSPRQTARTRVGVEASERSHRHRVSLRWTYAHDRALGTKEVTPMTYHAPDLLLAGAAQNLVLTTSPLDHKEAGICVRENAPPGIGPEYGLVDTW